MRPISLFSLLATTLLASAAHLPRRHRSGCGLSSGANNTFSLQISTVKLYNTSRPSLLSSRTMATAPILSFATSSHVDLADLSQYTTESVTTQATSSTREAASSTEKVSTKTKTGGCQLGKQEVKSVELTVDQ